MQPTYIGFVERIFIYPGPLPRIGQSPFLLCPWTTYLGIWATNLSSGPQSQDKQRVRWVRYYDAVGRYTSGLTAHSIERRVLFRLTSVTTDLSCMIGKCKRDFFCSVLILRQYHDCIYTQLCGPTPKSLASVTSATWKASARKHCFLQAGLFALPGRTERQLSSQQAGGAVTSTRGFQLSVTPGPYTLSCR